MKTTILLTALTYWLPATAFLHVLPLDMIREILFQATQGKLKKEAGIYKTLSETSCSFCTYVRNNAVFKTLHPQLIKECEALKKDRRYLLKKIFHLKDLEEDKYDTELISKILPQHCPEIIKLCIQKNVGIYKPLQYFNIPVDDQNVALAIAKNLPKESINERKEVISYTLLTSPLMQIAIDNSWWPVLKVLIKRDYDLNFDITPYFSPHRGCLNLHRAVQRNKKKIVQYLLKHGANIKTIFHQTTVMHVAASYSTELLTFLYKLWPEGIYELSNVGISTIYSALENNNVSALTWLISKKVPVNPRNRCFLPLDYAIKYCSLPVVEILLKAGADPNMKYQTGDHWLRRFKFVKKPNLKKIELAIQFGLDINIEDRNSETVLFPWVQRDPFCRNIFYSYPKNERIFYNLAQLFMQHNVNPFITNKKGETALEKTKRKLRKISRIQTELIKALTKYIQLLEGYEKEYKKTKKV